MVRQTEVDIILGCGEKGMYWSPRAMANELIVPFDYQALSYPTANFIVGDVLNIPILDNSADKVFGDFVLNAVEMKGADMTELIHNPKLLGEKGRPDKVKRWFTDTLRGSPEKFEKNMEGLRWVLREIALQEMWRVTKDGGSITLVDHAHIINWVVAKRSQILQSDFYSSSLTLPQFVDQDLDRSASLKKVLDMGAKPKKAIIRKAPLQLSFAEVLQQEAYGRVSFY